MLQQSRWTAPSALAAYDRYSSIAMTKTPNFSMVQEPLSLPMTPRLSYSRLMPHNSPNCRFAGEFAMGCMTQRIPAGERMRMSTQQLMLDINPGETEVFGAAITPDLNGSHVRLITEFSDCPAGAITPVAACVNP